MGMRSGRRHAGFGMADRRTQEMENSRLRAQAFAIGDDSVRWAFADLRIDGAGFVSDGKLGDNWPVIEKVIEHRKHRGDHFWEDPVDITAYELGLLVFDRALIRQCEVIGKPVPHLTESSRKKLLGGHEQPTADDIFDVQREGFRRIALELLIGAIDAAKIKSFLKGARDYNFMLHHLMLSEKASHRKGKKGKQ